MVDLIDMQKDPAKYGIDVDFIEEFEKRIDFITFKVNDKKEGIISEYEGKVVFPERGFEKTFHSNETWLCQLKKNNNIYRAKPIKKIDSSFFFELKVEQINKIAEVIWQKHKATFEPLFEKKFLSTIETLNSETIDEYEKEIQMFKNQISELEQFVAADKKIIESLQKNVDVVNLNENSIESKSTKVPPGYPILDEYTNIAAYQFLQKNVVERIKPDTITSKSFTKSRYFVHISKDMKSLLVRPHEYGDAICIYNKIELVGLGAMVPFDTPKELNAEYSPTYGGLLISL